MCVLAHMLTFLWAEFELICVCLCASVCVWAHVCWWVCVGSCMRVQKRKREAQVFLEGRGFVKLIISHGNTGNEKGSASGILITTFIADI